MNLSKLRSNPFAVEAWFDSSCTLTFAVPQDEVARRLPRGLVPDTFENRFAFVAVAVVQTRALRIAGFPRFLGKDFVLVGYRYFVRCTLSNGRTLRGLYILRSETDSVIMSQLGNIFTRYNYIQTQVKVRHLDHQIKINDAKTGLSIAAMNVDNSLIPLPESSPFADWKQARRFCGPMPFTFSVDEECHQVHIVEGERSTWTPQPVQILNYEVPFLNQFGHSAQKLACAFAVENISYKWKPGRIEPLPKL